MNKKLRISLVLGVLALLLAAPYWGLPVHLQSLLYVIFFWMTLATSWNMLSGYSGYFSFGHGAFFGVGMYGMATLATKADWPVVPAALGSGVLAALLALAIGALVFNVRKIRGESFALITLAVGFVLATVVVNTPIDGGPGVYLMGVSLPQWGPKPASTFYYASLVLTAQGWACWPSTTMKMPPKSMACPPSGSRWALLPCRVFLPVSWGPSMRCMCPTSRWARPSTSRSL